MQYARHRTPRVQSSYTVEVPIIHIVISALRMGGSYLALHLRHRQAVADYNTHTSLPLDTDRNIISPMLESCVCSDDTVGKWVNGNVAIGLVGLEGRS